ncbi:MAG: hypothetical protein GC181_13210 [Bacteroidetes bacterium]|nr:hypothetical protein [Bacteroidota bacterium]
MNQERTHTDLAFEEKLRSFEPEFQSGDWDQMLALLEEEDALVLPPLNISDKQKTSLKKLFTMTFMTIATGIALLINPAGSGNKKIQETMFVSPTITTSPAVVADKPETLTYQTESSDQNNSNSKFNSAVTTVSGSRSKTAEAVSEADGNSGTASEIPAKTAGKSDVDPPQLSVTKKDSTGQEEFKFYKTITRRYWVEDRYTYKYLKPENDIEDFWFGIHYTQQNLLKPALWDSIGRRQKTYGFNLQFMSGNILPTERFAIYAGLDWGMQFYGRSDKNEIIINSANQDRGFSYLHSNVNDLMVKTHIEYASGPVIPYVNLGFGTRIFSTGQTVKALITSKDYESSTSHNVLTTATSVIDLGVGTRVKLSPWVSLDLRYDMMMAGNADILNYSTSKFNGLTYDVKKSKMDMSGSMFKIGFIFDLSSQEREKVLVDSAHWEEVTEDLYMSTEDSSKVLIPCDCPCYKKKYSSNEEDEDVNYRSFPFESYPEKSSGSTGRGTSGSGTTRNHTWYGTGSSGGSGKSSFPGTSPAPNRTK